MTETGIRELLRDFAATYGERFDTGLPVAAVEKVWREALTDLDDETGKAAAAAVRRSLRHPANPADVLDAATSLGWKRPKPSAWESIRAALTSGKPDAERRTRLLLGKHGALIHIGAPGDPPLPALLPDRAAPVALAPITAPAPAPTAGRASAAVAVTWLNAQTALVGFDNGTWAVWRKRPGVVQGDFASATEARAFVVKRLRETGQDTEADALEGWAA